jgi:predicted secreted protein
MTITGAIVMFSVTWFLVFLCILPTRQVSQYATGEIVPGSAKSAPMDPQLWRKAKITTLITFILWAIMCGVILSGKISVFDTDIFHLVPRVKV